MIGLNNSLNPAIIYNLTITSKNGETVDLIRSFTTIEIYEDIFQKYLTGILVMNDTDDFVKSLPIIGGERIILAFSGSFEQSARFIDFIVDSVLPQQIASDEMHKNPKIILKLVCEDAITSEQIRYSKTFEDSTTTIIQNILSDIESKVDAIVPFLGNMMNFTSNFWNMNQIIDYMCSQNEDLMFFQTAIGYRFNKLSYFLAQEPAQQFINHTNFETRLSNLAVLKYTIDKYFNLQRLYEMKAFGQTVYQPSIDNYSFQKDQKSLYEMMGTDIPLLGQNKTFNPTLSTNQNDVGAFHNDFDSALKRNLILQTLQNYNVIAQMLGSVDRKIGDVIVFNMPASDNSIINSHFQNRWLITQIKHMITSNNNYMQNIRLFKNAFFNNAKVG
jgi:hypothetical protein